MKLALIVLTCTIPNQKVAVQVNFSLNSILFYTSRFFANSDFFSQGGDCCTAYERYPSELVYQKKAEKLLSDENCMKIYIVRNLGSPKSIIVLTFYLQ